MRTNRFRMIVAAVAAGLCLAPVSLAGAWSDAPADRACRTCDGGGSIKIDVRAKRCGFSVSWGTRHSRPPACSPKRVLRKPECTPKRRWSPSRWRAPRKHGPPPRWRTAPKPRQRCAPPRWRQPPTRCGGPAVCAVGRGCEACVPLAGWLVVNGRSHAIPAEDALSSIARVLAESGYGVEIAGPRGDRFVRLCGYPRLRWSAVACHARISYGCGEVVIRLG